MQPSKKIRRLKKALKVSDRKKLLTMIHEYLVYKLTKPELAEQYFNKFLFRQSVPNPSDYIVTHKLAEHIWYYNDFSYKFIFTDKIISELFFSQFNIPVVRSFAYNINKIFYSEGKLTLINNTEDFKNYLSGLKAKEIWKEDQMIVKIKENSYGGRNIYKISFKDMINNRSILEALYKDVINSRYLFQNVVVQHPELNKITPSSLNTIRIDTFTNKDGTSKILNTTLRFSCKNTYVDNISSGGMFVGVNMKTGKLREEAFSNFDTGSGEIILSHPITSMVFKDFQIPFFQQAIQLTLNAAKLLPLVKVVGWDVGISTSGPVLLEGNYFNGLYPFELGQKGHRNNPVFQELLDEVAVFYNEEGNNLDELKKKNPLFV